MIHLLFFGQIAEIAGVSSMQLTEILDSDSLHIFLKNQFPAIETMQYMLAVNKSIVRKKTIFHDGDTVAILPPFSGG